MKGEHLYVTARQAAQISMAWIGGNKAFIFDGATYAFHQVLDISPLKKEEAFVKFGNKELPAMEQFLVANPNQVLLT